MRPGARGGIPASYTIATVQIVANNQDEVWDMIRSMQQWAAGTFQPVVMERETPDGPLIVSPSGQVNEVPEQIENKNAENVEIDQFTGYPL
jgi:hypothetical protein